MLRQLQSKLRPIRLRQRFDRALRWATAGLVAGAMLGSMWYVAAWAGAGMAPPVAWLILAACCVSAAIAGLAWPTSWQSSARLVDGAYELKDRTLTALDFAGRKHTDALQAMQMNDAAQHLSDIDARRVVPWQIPQLVPAAIAALGVMIALGFLPLAPPASVANAPAGPLDVVLDQAAVLEETMLKDLEELAEELDDPELEQLAEEMKQAVDELQEPDVDEREALAKLSEMQAELSAAVEALDVQRVDAQLQELAEALQVADSAQSASQSLKAANYEKAAEELEKIDASTMSKKERDAMESNLARLANKLGQGKKGQLSEAVEEMAEGLSSGDNSKAKSGLGKAAGVCRKQGLRKKISDCLACQLNRLAECKGCCQAGFSLCQSVAKSDNPSNRASLGASNRPLGDEKTRLDSTRRQEDLTGTPGEGPSERETLASAEARQDAARGYRERYVEYRKQMEEVLDSEPLPLGHRETVRKYFESIRPSNDEGELIEGN